MVKILILVFLWTVDVIESLCNLRVLRVSVVTLRTTLSHFTTTR